MNLTDETNPIISRWANGSNGLDALLDIWNVIFGLAVFFLARILGLLYIINNVADDALRSKCRDKLKLTTVFFLVLFLPFLIRTLLKQGFASDPATGVIVMEPMKYLHNLLDMWYVLILLLIGVGLLLYAILTTIRRKDNISGIWFAGVGVVIVVLCLLLCAGLNDTAYYPSNADLQSSLTIANSCSNEFTLRTMTYVSFLIPFVLAYIVYAWRAIDSKKIDREEIAGKDHIY